jgi:hypothetical protein
VQIESLVDRVGYNPPQQLNEIPISPQNSTFSQRLHEQQNASYNPYDPYKYSDDQQKSSQELPRASGEQEASQSKNLQTERRQGNSDDKSRATSDDSGKESTERKVRDNAAFERGKGSRIQEQLNSDVRQGAGSKSLNKGLSEGLGFQESELKRTQAQDAKGGLKFAPVDGHTKNRRADLKLVEQSESQGLVPDAQAKSIKSGIKEAIDSPARDQTKLDSKRTGTEAKADHQDPNIPKGNAQAILEPETEKQQTSSISSSGSETNHATMSPQLEQSLVFKGKQSLEDGLNTARVLKQEIPTKNGQAKVRVIDLRSASGRLEALRKSASNSDPGLSGRTRVSLIGANPPSVSTSVIKGNSHTISGPGAQNLQNFENGPVTHGLKQVFTPVSTEQPSFGGWMSNLGSAQLKGQPKSSMGSLWGRGISEIALSTNQGPKGTEMSKDGQSREQAVKPGEEGYFSNLDKDTLSQTLRFSNAGSTESAKNLFTQYLQGAGAYDLVRSAKFVLKDNDKGEITLILKPEKLGEVKISLFLSDNRIEGSVSVENEEVRQAFSESMEALSKAFSESGFEFGDFTVSLLENGNQQIVNQPNIAAPGEDDSANNYPERGQVDSQINIEV